MSYKLASYWNLWRRHPFAFMQSVSCTMHLVSAKWCSTLQQREEAVHLSGVTHPTGEAASSATFQENLRGSSSGEARVTVDFKSKFVSVKIVVKSVSQEICSRTFTEELSMRRGKKETETSKMPGNGTMATWSVEGSATHKNGWAVCHSGSLENLHVFFLSFT